MTEITKSEINLEKFCSYAEKAPKPLIPQSIVSQTRTGFLFHQLQGTICPHENSQLDQHVFQPIRRTVPSQTQ